MMFRPLEITPWLGALLVLSLALTACSAPLARKAETHVADQQWLKAVLEYRKAYEANPRDVELKSRLKQTEYKAADFYYQRGLDELGRGDLDGAVSEFQQGLIAMPDHAKLRQAMNDVLARRESQAVYEEALRNQEIGRVSDAEHLLRRALELYPENASAAAALERITVEREAQAAGRLALSSREPITLNFRQTDLKTAFEFVAKSFGINVIFDEAVKDTPVTLYAKDVTFEQALNLMLTTTDTFHKRIGRNSILIAPNSGEKRGQYEDHLIRTFHMRSLKAADMANILKGVLTIKKTIVNEELNALVIRDTEQVLSLAEKLIELNDRKPAEMILEVEILEVNRNKAEQLGLDLGSQITVTYDSFPVSGSWNDALQSGVTTLPAMTFRYFKQDVDAKTLANPKIRVINNKPATIHIGDRIPLRSSTIQDATGQTRTTFEYRDIGIKLNVQPDIHLDNSTTVKLTLEVSTLGQNLGTTNEPAFSIGTRNADTFMLLRDGETAILGGLIRDEDRQTRVKVPGFGDIPVLGALFTQRDDSLTRTDVLLTITPRVVRSWELPPKSDRSLYSGTEKQYSSTPMFAYLDQSAEGGGAPEIRLESETSDVPGRDGGSAPANARLGATPARGTAVGSIPAPAPAQPLLSFSKPLYSASIEQPVLVDLTGRHLQSVGDLPLEVLFNPSILAFEGAERGDAGLEDLDATVDESEGVIRLNLAGLRVPAGDASSVIARLRLRPVAPGISYLLYRTQRYTTRDGDPVNAQVRAARIKVE